MSDRRRRELERQLQADGIDYRVTTQHLIDCTLQTLRREAGIMRKGIEYMERHRPHAAHSERWRQIKLDRLHLILELIEAWERDPAADWTNGVEAVAGGRGL